MNRRWLVCGLGAAAIALPVPRYCAAQAGQRRIPVVAYVSPGASALPLTDVFTQAMRDLLIYSRSRNWVAGKVSRWFSGTPTFRRRTDARPLNGLCVDRSALSQQRQWELSSTMISTCRTHQEWRGTEVPEVTGEPCGTRTHDPLIKSQVLYRLS